MALTILKLSALATDHNMDVMVKAITMGVPLPHHSISLEDMAEWAGLVGKAFSLYQSYLRGQCPFLTYCSSYEDCIDFLTLGEDFIPQSTIPANSQPC